MRSIPKPAEPGLALDVTAMCAAIEAERIRCKLTAQQVADQLGVSTSTMRYWRLGANCPTGDALLRVFAWLGFEGLDLREFTRQRHSADPLPAAKTEAA